MKFAARLMLASALTCSAPAFAGEEVLYQPAPAWVDEAALPQVRPGPPIVLFDDQRRIEEGRLLSYVDRAVRIDNPQMLTAAGTVQASWLPDKGDLIVHRISILRDGQEIDVLKQGARFEVLRRERQLEQRMLDGSYTATLPVPGLRVGDVLRMSYTISLSDQALDKEVQTLAPLPSEPFQAGFGRIRVSWPENAEVRWRASRGVELPAPVVKDGFATLELALPLAKLDDVPEDAPLRYQMPPLLQVGTFADWKEVSGVMAPLYATEGTVEPGGPIAREVAAIEVAHSQPLERAVAALRLVQDQVAYLLNGMQGGNYIPQKPAETWEKRYGDCKAKTMLLLAMLREMGIEAEPVVVASAIGDAVPGLLPMPAAFDHVIVHAVIDGTDYWLDGTNAGASMDVVHEVPDFHVALPLRAGGADLIAMPQRPQHSFDRELTFTLDHRAGLDIPAPYEAEWQLRGPSAAALRGVVEQASKEQLDEYMSQFAESQLGPGRVIESHIDYNEADNSAVIRASGLMASKWQWERGRGSRELGLPTTTFEFRPDRSRPAWRDIPVAVAGPVSEQLRMTILLPESGREPYKLDGRATFEDEVATVRLQRDARLEGDRLVVTDSAAYPGGEIVPGEIAQERARAARFGSTKLVLRAPGDAVRAFSSAGGDRSRFAPIEAAFARIIADDPDALDRYRERANFRASTYDREGALADLGLVLEREPDAGSHLRRAALLVEAGDYERALADTESAWELDPSLPSALARANVLPYLGRTDEAIALLEEQRGDAGERATLAMAIGDLEALTGRKDDGLRRIVEGLTQRPGDPELLNARCWYQATWNYQPQELAEICTEAVEKADWSPQVLDSRAMGYYRLGRYEDALKDLEAVLSTSPEIAASLFMRGIVRRAMGDRGWERDVRDALARQPSLARTYARFGIKAD